MGIALMALFAGCANGDGATVGLYLSVSAAPADNAEQFQRLRVVLVQGDIVWPPAGAADGQIPLGERDLRVKPVLLQLATDGATFSSGGVVQTRVTGETDDGAIIALWEGAVDLGAQRTYEVELRPLTQACDVDGDGFVDCTVAGCCASGTSPFQDCVPDDPTANPLAIEPACEPCDDVVDQDCDGQDTPCIDGDLDGVADCIEAQAECGLDDPAIAPGLPERCDGVDNNCDGVTDEGFGLPGTNAPIGSPCGQENSPCANGVVICGDPQPRCTSDIYREPAEICGNGVDDDCDGDIDQGCLAEDLDGDTYTGEADCNDYDTAFHEDAPEPCCPTALSTGVDPESPPEDILLLCDFNCDGTVGFCAVDDMDGDGFSPPTDCDDSDPTTYPGAVDVCDDGIDNDCFGGDVPCDSVDDFDGDGYPDDFDCEPDDPFINPSVPEACDGIDNDCDGQTDEGNPGGGGECGIDIGECTRGINVCAKTIEGSQTKCVGATSPTEETCDGLDNDCDGLTDEDMLYDGAPVGAPCDGVGSCGLGVVECAIDGAVTCSTNPDGSAPEDTPELCDLFDNDCDGDVNEDLSSVSDSTCKTAGVCGLDGATVTATCTPQGTWSCDYSQVPDYSGDVEIACDEVDEDCDGTTDEDFGVGLGCDGDDDDACQNGLIQCDPATGPTATRCEEQGVAVEICDGVDNDCDGLTDEDFDLGVACDSPFDPDQCANGVTVCTADGKATVCGPETLSNIVELCDGLDNDCDGETDEGFELIGQACDDPDETGDFCANGTFECSGGALVCSGDVAVVELCDGVDNDCDGVTDELATQLGQPCDGSDADACADGVFVCPSDGSNSNLTCSDDAESAVELCNNEDDDCDGLTDEDLSVAGGEVSCVNLGVCAQPELVATCSSGTWLCDYAALADYMIAEEGTVDGCDGLDNDCDGDTDEGFADLDFDQIADCVDDDLDGDGLGDNENGNGFGFPCTAGQSSNCDDNCPFIKNADQLDIDNDGVGNVCDPDRDGDGILNGVDNCPHVANEDQADSDEDGFGDVCETACQPGSTYCGEDGRTLEICGADGGGPEPGMGVLCSYLCRDDACVAPSNLSDSDVASCGAGAPDLWVPFNALAQIGNELLSCPNCQGISDGKLSPHSSDDQTVVYCLNSLIVDNGGMLSSPNDTSIATSKSVIFIVHESVVIAGDVSVNGRPGSGNQGGKGGNGGYKGANRCNTDECTGGNGQGPGGGKGGSGDYSFWGTGEAGGGAGGSYAGDGGDGGSSESVSGGQATGSYGDASLTPLQGGSGGGGGGRHNTDTGQHGAGGGGGGAIQWTVRGAFTLATTGVLSAIGGQGGSAQSRGGAGGGGSGGGILVEAREYFNQGGNLLVLGGKGGSSAAGSGGSGASGSLQGDDGASSSDGGEGGAGGGGGSGWILVSAITGADCGGSSPNVACTANDL